MGFFSAEGKAAAVIPSSPLGKVVRNRIAAIAARKKKTIPWAHYSRGNVAREPWRNKRAEPEGGNKC